MYIFTPRSILLIKKHYIHPKTTGQEVAFFSYMKNYGMPMLIDRSRGEARPKLTMVHSTRNLHKFARLYGNFEYN
jgi:hypothetical protein